MYGKSAMIEHTVYVSSIGGGTTLSCESLQIKNIEYPHKELTKEGIIDTIVKYKYLTEADKDMDILVVDNRPKEENYNEQRAKESTEIKKRRNDMTTARM